MPPPIAAPPVCPLCGQPLQVIGTLDPQTAPWGCYPCGRGWWVAELAAASQMPDLLDPNLGWLSDIRTVGVLAACEGEMAQAFDRGTSLRPEQIPAADPSFLDRLTKRRTVSDAMKQAIAQHHPAKARRARKAAKS